MTDSLYEPERMERDLRENPITKQEAESLEIDG